MSGRSILLQRDFQEVHFCLYGTLNLGKSFLNISLGQPPEAWCRYTHFDKQNCPQRYSDMLLENAMDQFSMCLKNVYITYHAVAHVADYNAVAHVAEYRHIIHT